MSFLPAIVDEIRCVAMPGGTLLLFPYSLRRQTIKGAKSGIPVPQNTLTVLTQAAVFTAALHTQSPGNWRFGIKLHILG